MSFLQIYAVVSAVLFTLLTFFILKEEEKTKKVGRDRDDFTNIMVHELRAPLIALKDAAIYLRDKHESMPKEEKDKFFAIITQQSDTLLEEIGSLLDAAKLENGKFTIQKVSTDIKKLIAEKIDFFTSEAEEKHVTISVATDENLPLILADPIRISQVLNNLISNSLKFTPEGGKITISSTISGNSLKISVADTGYGIAKDKQKKLFGKFVQANSNSGRAASGPGTGLGLFIAKGIVDAHGGTITLESEENQGTTITFYLPITTSAVISHVENTKTLPNAAHLQPALTA